VRRELWAAAGNFGDSPPLERDDPASRGKGALFRFDLKSGALIGVYRGAGEPQFNDLVVTGEGDVYTTAGGAGIWRLRAGAEAVEPFLAPEGSFFNGIAITADGRSIFAASHREGVLKIDVATKAYSRLDVPPGTILGGIDGLYVHENSLVAVQNGTDPMRVIRAWLDPEMTRVVRFAVLEQEHPESDFPLTGTIVGDHLYYVARSQLRAFEDGKIWPDEKLQDSIILKLPLEIAAAPSPDLAAEREALLEMHRGEIRAHVELDAESIAAGHGEDFASASRGKIDRVTRAQALAFFTGYFEGASYPQYDDIEPPIVRVSGDGSMGWILSRTRVRRVKGGKEITFVYAGMMAYEKRNGRWIRVANASTFE
ncbi:MAG TPA: nuclear transport factor 2 family protein, partial [Thermoanaerobaculia bacterium]|nr:nuclear transport factor 2 family protein [Thermoanaerobaculia bacterium]